MQKAAAELQRPEAAVASTFIAIRRNFLEGLLVPGQLLVERLWAWGQLNGNTLGVGKLPRFSPEEIDRASKALGLAVPDVKALLGTFLFLRSDTIPPPQRYLEVKPTPTPEELHAAMLEAQARDLAAHRKYLENHDHHSGPTMGVYGSMTRD